MAVLVGALLPAAAQADTNLCNQAITADDGTVLRANVFLPGDGKAAYPAVMTVTGYNKDVAHPPGSGCAAGDGLSGGDPALVAKGYAVVVFDDRGTGASGGTWDSWSERTKQDYPELLDWVAAQKWFNGRAAMRGGSYMGITSLFMAEADAARVKAGKPRVVDAVFADVPMADAYRDVTFHGGAVDAGFIPLWLGLTSGLSDIPPSTLVSDPASALPTYAGHLANTYAFAGATAADAATGGDHAFDGPFYRTRSPIEDIKALTIPVAWAGGWWDIFQRGEPLLYEQMTNSAHRTFFMTPNYHGAADPTAWAKQGMGSEEDFVVRWMDHWLKGTDNGVEKTPPVNLYAMGADRWEHPADWPLPGTQYTPYYLGASKSLGTTAPSAAGSDTIPLLPASSPCSRLSAQWTAGAGAIGNCPTDNSSFESTALTYTTPPLEHDTEVAGLIKADIWATLTGATDATLVAVLSDVDGNQSNQVTAGFLLASQRAVDDAKATRAPDGTVIRPYHPFTKASQQPVPPGQPQEYQIEIYPTANVFKAGHRIRLTIASSDTPGTLPPVPDAANETGTLVVQHAPGMRSSVLLPLTDARGDAAVLPQSLPPTATCKSRRVFAVRLPRLTHQRIVKAIVTIDGRRVAVVRGRRLRAPVDLRGLPKGAFKVTVTATTSTGRVLRQTRTYRTCQARR